MCRSLSIFRLVLGKWGFCRSVALLFSDLSLQRNVDVSVWYQNASYYYWLFSLAAPVGDCMTSVGAVTERRSLVPPCRGSHWHSSRDRRPGAEAHLPLQKLRGHGDWTEHDHGSHGSLARWTWPDVWWPATPLAPCISWHGVYTVSNY